MNISFLKEKGNRYIIFILLGLLAVVLLIPANSFEQSTDTTETVQVTKTQMETQLESVLFAMEGVGKVEVMITLENTQSSLFGTEDENGKVCGVVVVAEGAGDAVVETRISNAVKALFSIDVHKISIVKMKSQEEDK